MDNTYSVLMSVYYKDSPEFLKAALRSIYDEQTHQPDEVVIVFDGPIPSDLENVLNEFKDGKGDVVKFLPQEVNKGLGEALRIGSGECSGNYIFRMDSDDVCDPHRFEKQIKYIEAHPNVDVVGSNIAEFCDSIDEENQRIRVCPTDHEDIVKMSKKRNPMNHVSVCVRKEALERSGGYRTLLLLEDYYLWLRMIQSGCVFANINESLVHVRVGNGFNSKRGSRIRISGWKVLQNYMLEHNMITKHEARMNMLYIRGFVYTPTCMKKVLYDKLLRK